MDRETRIDRLLHYLLDSEIVVGPVKKEVESLLEPDSQSDDEFAQSIGITLCDDSGALTLPYALLGIAGYLLYWMISHGIIQALTALQVGR